MHCGLKRDGDPGAWCDECFTQASESGALDVVRARGASVSSAFEKSKRPAEPPSGELQPKKQRSPAKTERALKPKSKPPELAPCCCEHKWSKCGGCKGHTGLECQRVTDEDRLRYRKLFARVRTENRPMALQRAMSLVYQGMRWPVYYPRPDANPAQACMHCRHLVRSEWEPSKTHNSKSCGHRDDVCAGAARAEQAEYWLWTSEHGDVRVCRDFYRDTWGISHHKLKRMLDIGPCFELPPDAFVWGGRKPSEMMQLTLEYVMSLERHFSHYSMSSTTEYTDAANSVLQLWKGPCVARSDGSEQLCFLEWLDKKKSTGHHKYFKGKGWFPGVQSSRAGAEKPKSVGADAPKLAVPYKFMLKVMNKYDLKLQDKTEDKCETCMLLIWMRSGRSPLRHSPKSTMTVTTTSDPGLKTRLEIPDLWL